MVQNYITIALRNIVKYKGYSLINIIGLAIGMACCFLIMMWIMDELSFDRFHDNADTIYRIEQDQDYSGRVYHVNVTPYPMAQGLKDEIPEVKYATPYLYTGTLLLRKEQEAFFESGVRAVSPDFFNMFTFPFVRGDKNSAFENPHSLVVTEKIADKYFGIEDPIGKVITINNRFDFLVTGVLQNIPPNTILQFDMLVPFEFMKDLGRTMDQWGWNSIENFVQLHEKVVIDEVNSKITDLRHRKVLESLQDSPDDLEQYRKRKKTPFMVAPLKDIHLHQYWGYSRAVGDILYVYIFTIIALFVLLIACINFMNLSTARAAIRSKEIGLRKVIGAVKSDLIVQFFGESTLSAFIGLFFSLILIGLLLPVFSEIAGKEFTIKTIMRWNFLIGMIVVTLITGLLSGSYPALFLSAFQPAMILRGGPNTGTKGAGFRKVLVVFQFTLSIALVIGTLTVYNQLYFMKIKELGYDKEHLLYIPLRGESRKSYKVLKNTLLSDGKVVNVTGTNHDPTRIGSNSDGVDWDGKDPNFNVLVSFNAVDFDYLETMKIDLIEGRSFSKSFATDTVNAFMVNEELEKIMGAQSAVNKRLSFLDKDGVIIGVMNNYHFQSVKENIEPLAIYVNPNIVNYLVIRLKAGDIPGQIEYVKKTWERLIPNYPFDHQFVDQDLDRMYRGWDRLSSLLNYFAVLAILISCLGLFGLASFIAEQQTKEIGIRKVLGASVPSILVLMLKAFAKWILVANIIAWPVSYYIMNEWLKDFAYRIQMRPGTFVLSAALAMTIALMTVSYQAFKAAMADPVKSLKYE